MIKVFKVKYIIIVLTAIALIISVTIFSSEEYLVSKASPSMGLTIVLDAGHGRLDIK